MVEDIWGIMVDEDVWGEADEEVWHVDLGLVLDVGSEDVWGMADVYFATRYISRPSKVLTSASELGHKLILEGPLRIWVACFERVGAVSFLLFLLPFPHQAANTLREQFQLPCGGPLLFLHLCFVT